MVGKNKKLLYFILILSMIFRIILALNNTWANDNHYFLVKHIADNPQIISADNCPLDVDPTDCSSPKLFYIINALSYNVFNIHKDESRIVFSQLLNVILCQTMLYYILLFLDSLDIRDNTKLIVFSMIAFNPALIRISIQVAQDMFVIGFSTLALFFGYNFFKKKKDRDFIYMSLFSVFAALSKTNGVLLFFIIVISFVLGLFKEKEKVFYYKHLFLFILLYLSIVPFFGQYMGSITHHGQVNYYDVGLKNSFPKFFQETKIVYNKNICPGIISIYDGYFTFPFFNLVKNPYVYDVVCDISNSFKHMNSLWTSLYGRAFFIPYSCGPFNAIFMGTFFNNIIKNVGRIIFVLGLLPLAILLKSVFRALLKIKEYISKREIATIFFLISIMGYLSLVIYLSIIDRHFMSMKVIYIYPVLLAFIYFFAKELDDFFEFFSKKKYLFSLINFVFGAIIILHIYDIIHLIMFILSFY